MEKLRMTDLPDSESRVLLHLYANRQIEQGGVHVFQSGERTRLGPAGTSLDEVLVVLQGFGFVPLNGKDHPIETGDFVALEPGEERNVVSSEEDPLVIAWYVMEPVDRAKHLGI